MIVAFGFGALCSFLLIVLVTSKKNTNCVESLEEANARLIKLRKEFQDNCKEKENDALLYQRDPKRRKA